MTKVSLKPLIVLNYSLVAGVFGLYFLNNLLLKKIFTIALIQNHLNDFLFPILLNSVCFIILSTLFTKKVNWLRIFVLNYIITSILFEFILPIFVHNITGDFLDCIAYFCGLIVYLVLFRRYDTNNILQIRRRKITTTH